MRVADGNTDTSSLVVVSVWAHSSSNNKCYVLDQTDEDAHSTERTNVSARQVLQDSTTQYSEHRAIEDVESSWTVNDFGLLVREARKQLELRLLREMKGLWKT